MIEVKFGTAVPFAFREIDTSIGLDMEVHARLIGTAMVEDYDQTLYDGEDKVREAIKSNLNEIITRCVNDKWDKELSVISKAKELLGPMMDQELKEIGITAQTAINSMAVLPEDAEKIRELRRANVQAPTYSSNDCADMNSFENALRADQMSAVWRCPLCGTENKGEMCSNCGCQSPLRFFLGGDKS